MIDQSLLYNLFKPAGNPDAITPFEVIIGGSGAVADFEKGTIIITPILSVPISEPTRNLNEAEQVGDAYKFTQYTLIKNTYQIDIYITPKTGATFNVAFETALKLREYITSLDADDILRPAKAYAFPVVNSQIRVLNEFTDQKKLVNRAMFEFSLGEVSYIKQEVQEVKQVDFNPRVII